MKVLRIFTVKGGPTAPVFMPIERGYGYGAIDPHFPDATHVDLVEMTPEELQAIPATNESFARFHA